MAEEWVGGTIAKQSGWHRTDGVAQQTLADPRAQVPLAKDTHYHQLNDHVYTGKLDAEHAVFTYKPLSKGPYAQKLDVPTPEVPKEEPKGRARAAADFFE